MEVVHGFLSDSATIMLFFVELAKFKYDRIDFSWRSRSYDSSIGDMQSAGVTFSDHLRLLGTLTEYVLKKVPGTTWWKTLKLKVEKACLSDLF